MRTIARTIATVGAAAGLLTGTAYLPVTSAQAADGVATVMVTTQRMSDATLNSTQHGTYARGSRLTLKCYKRGQAVRGYYSSSFTNGYDNLWYKVSDGYFVADVDINTGSNAPITGACPTPTAPAPSSGQLIVPFTRGQTWYVCQGYNGGVTHQGRMHLDLTTNPNSWGSRGCTGAANGAAGKPVYAPGSGTLYQVSNALGGVCINLDSGRSIYLGHLVGRRANGRVTAGTQIGVVAKGYPVTAGNGGYAHVHIQMHATRGCGSARSIPFTSANSAKFQGVRDLTYSGAPQQWAGTVFRRN